MTLPFENDTSRIVKKYAKHSISQSRVKTFLSVLTIALAVALLSGFALSVIGMETEAKRELLVSSQMLYHNLNDEQMQTLRHDERISDSKIYMQAANTQIENYLVIPVYIEQNNSQIVMDEIVEGQYPIDLYDVAVDKAYLEQLGLPVELGVTITIPFYDGNMEKLYCGRPYRQWFHRTGLLPFLFQTIYRSGKPIPAFCNSAGCSICSCG